MNFISGKKSFSPILFLLLGALVVFTVSDLGNKTKTPLAVEAVACVPVDQVSTTKTVVDKGECFDCSVRVAAGQGGGYYIACGLAVNNSWPQNICPSSTGYTGCSGFKGWVGDVATFGCQMPTTVANTDILELVGFDFSATCGPTTGRRIPITLKGTTPPPPTNTPIPNPNCPNGKVDNSGQCNPACCSNHSECNDPHVPGQQNQICTLSNGYCNSGYSCTSAPPPGPSGATGPTGSSGTTGATGPPGPPPPPPPPAQACQVGREYYLVGEAWCDEANNSVKRCLGNNNWLRLQLPDPCPGKRCVNDPDPTKHAYSCVSKCQPLVDNAGKKLKIAFLPENYSTFSEFLPVAQDAIKQIQNTNLGGLFSKMNFYIVSDFNQSYGRPNNSFSFGPSEWAKVEQTGSHMCGAEISVVIDNPTSCVSDGGGLAAGTPARSAYACGVKGHLVPHELGHAIAGLGDEYGGPGFDLAPATYGEKVNCSKVYSGSENVSCPKWAGKPYRVAVGCYQGCGGQIAGSTLGFSNLYRPWPDSIMRATLDNYNFNPPSLEAWENMLQTYQ